MLPFGFFQPFERPSCIAPLGIHAGHLDIGMTAFRGLEAVELRPRGHLSALHMVRQCEAELSCGVVGRYGGLTQTLRFVEAPRGEQRVRNGYTDENRIRLQR